MSLIAHRRSIKMGSGFQPSWAYAELDLRTVPGTLVRHGLFSSERWRNVGVIVSVTIKHDIEEVYILWGDDT